jgi:FeoB-associated Cys-rich membrane protein
MNWQLIVVSIIVLAAGGYLVRQSWRTWSGRKAGCGSGCGCGSKAADQVNGSAVLIPSEQITLRRRNPGES